MTFRIIFLLTAAVLTACAPEKEQSASEGVDERLIEVRESGTSAVSLRNYRRLLFARPLRGINSNEHFIFEARFIEANSKIVFHNHFMGFDRRNGVELLLERRGGDLEVKISTPDRIGIHLKTLSAVFAHGSYIRLRIEMHDGVPEGTHTLLWVDDLNGDSSRRQPLSLLTKATAAVDSAALGFVSAASGRGIFAGLETWSVELASARRDLPYVAD